MAFRLRHKTNESWFWYAADFYDRKDAEYYLGRMPDGSNYEVTEYPAPSPSLVDSGNRPNAEAGVQSQPSSRDGGKEQSDARDDGHKRTRMAEGVPGELDGADPSYYRTLIPEPIDVIEGWDLGPHLANVVKYASRYGRKHAPGDTGDLHKARAYLTRYISLVETGRGSWKLPGTTKDD